MEFAAQLLLSSIPKQRAVMITRTGRIITLRMTAAFLRIAMVNRLAIQRLTIAQIVRFVRLFPLREYWQF